jgi:ubiquinone/menaquinone biosynthesis C-methylase UbiE
VPAEWLVSPESDGVIDSFVNRAVGATNGNLYASVIGRLSRYPIPDFPLDRGNGRLLLDVGCNWGRWTLAASEAGFDAIGVDPSPEAVFAARRVSRKLGLSCRFVVGDARYLPFRDGVFDVGFSYSVWQHLSPDNVELSARSLARVVKVDADVLVQMASAAGIRSMYQMARRRFRRAREFEVRYWWPAHLVRLIGECIGHTTLEADSYLSLNAQRKDLDLMTPGGATVVRVSLALVELSKIVPGLAWFADSVWLRCRRDHPPEVNQHDRTAVRA